MKKLAASLRAMIFVIFAAAVVMLALWGWWQSSRFSERHLIYVGAGTIEFFSASSLVRISLVPGRVGDFGGKTFYRQRNARGKMLFRPAFPQFAKRSGIPEMTIGYWHLAVLSLILLVSAGAHDFKRFKARRALLAKNGAEGRN